MSITLILALSRYGEEAQLIIAHLPYELSAQPPHVFIIVINSGPSIHMVDNQKFLQSERQGMGKIRVSSHLVSG